MVAFSRLFSLTPPVIKQLLLDEFDLYAQHVDALAEANK